jgi:hypothetical protein
MQTEMGLWVSANVFRGLHKDIQDALVDALRGTGNKSLPTLSDENDEGLADFSVAQAKKFLSGCGEKTKNAIREMVKGNSRHFQLDDVAKTLGVEAETLSGVWAGITKRTRTVLDDPDAYLIGWGEDGCQGWLTEMTYNSLRRVFNS